LHPAVGRPSTVSPSPRSGAVNAKQPNSAFAPVNNPAASSAGGQAATAPPCGNNNKSKAAKSKSVPNGPKAQVSAPPATTQANGAAIGAIVEAVRNHSHPNGNGSTSLPTTTTTTTTDRNEFVREVLTLIHVRHAFLHLFYGSSSFTLSLDWIDRSLVRGPTLDGISCAGLAYVSARCFHWRAYL